MHNAGAAYACRWLCNAPHLRILMVAEGTQGALDDGYRRLSGQGCFADVCDPLRSPRN